MGKYPTNQTVFPRITSDDIEKDFFQIQRYSDQSILLWIDSYGYIHPQRPVLETNSVENSDQYRLNLIQGSGISLAAGERGAVTITATGGGGGGTPAGPLYAVQANNPLGTFYGDGSFIYDPVDIIIAGGLSNVVTSTSSVAFGTTNNVLASAGASSQFYAYGDGNDVGGGAGTGTQSDFYGIGNGNTLGGGTGNGERFNLFAFGDGNVLSPSGSGIGTDWYAIGDGNTVTTSSSQTLDDVYLFGDGNAVTGTITPSGSPGDFYLIGVGNEIDFSESACLESMYVVGDGNTISGAGATGQQMTDFFAVGNGNEVNGDGTGLYRDCYAFGKYNEVDITSSGTSENLYAVGDTNTVADNGGSVGNSDLFAFGSHNTVGGSGAADGDNSCAFGISNTVKYPNAIVLGANVTAPSANSVSIGISASPEITITAGITTLKSLLGLQKFTVSALPTGAEGQVCFASNGRKVGEGGGSGTGVPVYFSNSEWRVFSTDAQVQS
jgi:hypothetical protein